MLLMLSMIDVLCRHAYNSSDHQLVKRNNLFNRDIVLDVHLADYNFLFKKMFILVTDVLSLI